MASAARGPKQPQPELLRLGPVAAARTAVTARRATEGSDVRQADVDLVAEALIRAAVRPYPRAIVAVIGGSLSTVTPMFDDWWQRFVIRQLTPDTPGLDSQSKLSLHFRYLVAQWESVLRAHLTGSADPNEALIAAAKLGEQQGLRSQLTSLTADRDRLLENLQSMTYKVAELEARMNAQSANTVNAQAALTGAVARLTESVDRPVASRSNEVGFATLTQLAAEVRQLREALAQAPSRRRTKRHKKKAPAKSRQSRPSEKRSRSQRKASSRRARRTPKRKRQSKE